MMYQILMLVSCVFVSVLGHGRVVDPPSRASAWQHGFAVPRDYDDAGSNCGGIGRQWSVWNRGRCGICGDPYDEKTPRAHELGGKYGQGIIVKTYTTSVITITVDLTTSHRGFWEFKICKNPQRNDQECFDRYSLELENGGTKYYPERGNGVYRVNYRLPPGLTCDHCVLQWRYTAGNNWGLCPNGTQGLGCGPQEQFGACSDIAIVKLELESLDDNYVWHQQKKQKKTYSWGENRYYNTQRGGKHSI